MKDGRRLDQCSRWRLTELFPLLPSQHDHSEIRLCVSLIQPSTDPGFDEMASLYLVPKEGQDEVASGGQAPNMASLCVPTTRGIRIETTVPRDA